MGFRVLASLSGSWEFWVTRVWNVFLSYPRPPKVGKIMAPKPMKGYYSTYFLGPGTGPVRCGLRGIGTWVQGLVVPSQGQCAV